MTSLAIQTRDLPEMEALSPPTTNIVPLNGKDREVVEIKADYIPLWGWGRSPDEERKARIAFIVTVALAAIVGTIVALTASPAWIGAAVAGGIFAAGGLLILAALIDDDLG